MTKGLQVAPLDFRAVTTTGVIKQLMQIVGQRIRRVRALMQFEQHTAFGVRAVVSRNLDVVGPFDFVAHMVFVALIERIVWRELFVDIPERQGQGDQFRLARVASVFVPKFATRDRIDRRVP